MNDSVRLAQEAQAIFKAADANGRPLTADERVHVEDLLERATDAHNLETKMADMGDRLGAPDASAGFDPPFGRQGPGDVFIQSAGYKAIKDPTARSQTWSSGMVDVTTGGPALNMKGTLLETTAGGPGGGLVPPYNEPGIVSKLFEPLGVSDLFGQSQTTGGQVRYVNEGTATSGAAGVAEAAAKPESTLVLQRGRRAGPQDRDDPADQRRDAGRRPVGPGVPERPPFPVRPHRGGAPAAPWRGRRVERTGRDRRPVRGQHLQPRHGRQQRRVGEDDREHGRQRQLGAGRDRHAPVELPQHPVAARQRRHGGRVPWRRPVRAALRRPVRRAVRRRDLGPAGRC